MSDRMTSCSGPGFAPGVADYGRKTRAEMIGQYRAHFEHQRAEAEKALAIADEDLRVTTYLGPYAMKNRTEVTD